MKHLHFKKTPQKLQNIFKPYRTKVNPVYTQQDLLNKDTCPTAKWAKSDKQKQQIRI